MSQLPEDIGRPQPRVAPPAAGYATALPPEAVDPAGRQGLVAPAMYAAPGVALPLGLYYDQASGLNLPQDTQLVSAGCRIGASSWLSPRWVSVT